MILYIKRNVEHWFPPLKLMMMRAFTLHLFSSWELNLISTIRSDCVTWWILAMLLLIDMRLHMCSWLIELEWNFPAGFPVQFNRSIWPSNVWIEVGERTWLVERGRSRKPRHFMIYLLSFLLLGWFLLFS